MQVRKETGSVFSVRSLDDRDRQPRRCSTGRLCVEPGCLSIYNESEFCSLHVKSVMRIPGKKAP